VTVQAARDGELRDTDGDVLVSYLVQVGVAVGLALVAAVGELLLDEVGEDGERLLRTHTAERAVPISSDDGMHSGGWAQGGWATGMNVYTCALSMCSTTASFSIDAEKLKPLGAASTEPQQPSRT
jgi:hypothetical protein